VNPDDLEILVSREVSRLPTPRAPRTLLPRVMAAVAEMAGRPWYARAWRTWPIGWQIASAVACLLFVAGASLSLPVVQEFAVLHTSPLAGDLTLRFGGVFARLMETSRAIEVVWRVVVEPVAGYVLIPMLVMCAASLAFGAALGRLAFGGISQS
jgi:hypothetical protein